MLKGKQETLHTADSAPHSAMQGAILHTDGFHRIQELKLQLEISRGIKKSKLHKKGS